MIVTLTANPSIDRTVALTEALQRGALHRAQAATSHPGGKGINVSRVVSAAGVRSVAVLPGNLEDPLLLTLTELGIEHRHVDVAGHARTNLTITEPDGTTTKINESGNLLGAADLARLERVLSEAAATAHWVVLSGSLPPGAPVTWYADLVVMLALSPARIAVDSSDGPLRALAARFPISAPHLLKPNADELAQLTGIDADELERSAAHGDPTLAAKAGRTLVDRGVDTVLATLGSAGAVLITSNGAWHGAPPPITPRSTVGAGDSSLAGYLLAHIDGDGPEECLRHAIAYGAAAAALPGTALPTRHDTDPASVSITQIFG
ncbi:1-phosphofructokinase family hexose kinase [Antrihabitans stalactiti]|uniref:1-phosphofructokinase family hexose kinase n=1 Tax=Antrihabitans stalactiti TaxID=2584121 RepID=A0A848K9I5_9NOCA|nr:1-phosphofructokinase family hexose kinase [Antrihabitans stalactiti]NMN94108.1 1-phosphofructokinase family hexose kinase [Antrihabitans stalactiti]